MFVINFIKSQKEIDFEVIIYDIELNILVKNDKRIVYVQFDKDYEELD